MTFSNFNWLDYAFVSIFFLFILLSLWRGFVKEIISILAWVTGFVLAFSYAKPLAALFTNSSAAQSTVTSTQGSFAVGLSFIVLLVGTLIIGSIINYFMSFIVQASGLSIFNRLLGGIFGALKAFILGLVVIFFVQMTAYAEDPIWQNSEVVKAYQPILAGLENKFGPTIDSLKTKAEELGVTKYQ
jgi:membrane protein required for colicin V production